MCFFCRASFFQSQWGRLPKRWVPADDGGTLSLGTHPRPNLLCWWHMQSMSLNGTWTVVVLRFRLLLLILICLSSCDTHRICKIDGSVLNRSAPTLTTPKTRIRHYLSRQHPVMDIGTECQFHQFRRPNTVIKGTPLGFVIKLVIASVWISDQEVSLNWCWDPILMNRFHHSCCFNYEWRFLISIINEHWMGYE